MDLISREPEIEERKGKSTQNVPKEDLISRKAAINAVNGVIADYIPTLYGRYEALPLEMAMAIKRLPTVQPEKRTEKRTETHACDSISRRAAIDALIRKIRPHNNGDGTITMCVMSEELVRKTLDDLPSAQPEIIRCKDCRYTDEDGVCQSSKGLAIQDDDDFCSHAERREE